MQQYHPPREDPIARREQLAWARRCYETAPMPKGIGGWLVLPAIGLFGVLFMSIVGLVGNDLPAMALVMDGELSRPGMHSAWLPLLVYEMLVDLVLLGASIALIVLLFKKRRVFPKAIICFYAFAAIAIFIDWGAIWALGPDMIPNPALREEIGWTMEEMAVSMIRGVLPAVVWIPYFLLSERVKNTFLNPPITDWSHWQQNPPR